MNLDMASGGTSLSTRDTGEALRGLAIDVLFFDACLMGMIESAYEVREAADYFIAGQNLLFARLPYPEYLRDLDNRIDAETLTRRIVERYNPGPRAPFTISAVDLGQLRDAAPGDLTDTIKTLAERLLNTLPDPAPADDPLVQALQNAYRQAQKFDYDSSGTLDEREGYVDLVDFARLLSTDPSLPGDIRQAASAVVAAATEGETPVVIAQRSRDGVFNGADWSFAGANGLSIFLPLGERDYRPTRYDPVRPERAYPECQLSYYVDCDQLAFSCNLPQWAALLERLEETVPIIRTGPDGLPANLAIRLNAAGPQAEVTVDTRPFNTPYQIIPPDAVYLPLVLR